MIGAITMNGKQINWENAPDMLRIGQASELVGAHAQTLREWIHNGLLTAHRTGGGHFRIKKADLRALWESRLVVSEADRLRLALREILLTDDIIAAHRVANEALGEGE